MPPDEQSVALVLSVQGIGHHAVHVLDVGDYFRAEPGEVQLGIAEDQRVEGPRDGADPPLQRPCALVELERHPDTGTAAVVGHPRDVGVELGDLAHAGEGDRGAGERSVLAEGPVDVVAAQVECPQHVV